VPGAGGARNRPFRPWLALPCPAFSVA
jgi:hypothetical protein